MPAFPMAEVTCTNSVMSQDVKWKGGEPSTSSSAAWQRSGSDLLQLK